MDSFLNLAHSPNHHVIWYLNTKPSVWVYDQVVVLTGVNKLASCGWLPNTCQINSRLGMCHWSDYGNTVGACNMKVLWAISGTDNSWPFLDGTNLQPSISYNIIDRRILFWLV